MRPSRSMSTAASPVTQDCPPGGRSARIAVHQVPRRRRPADRRSTSNATDDDRPRRPSGCAGRTRATAGSSAPPRRPRRRSVAGSVRATTVIAGAAGRPNRSVERVGDPGRLDAARDAFQPGQPQLGGRASGAPAASSTAAVPSATSERPALHQRARAGRRSPARRSSAPRPRLGALARGVGRIQRRSSPISAGGEGQRGEHARPRRSRRRRRRARSASAGRT